MSVTIEEQIKEAIVSGKLLKHNSSCWSTSKFSFTGNDLFEYFSNQYFKEDLYSFTQKLVDEKKLKNLTNPKSTDFSKTDLYQFNKKITIVIIGGGISGGYLANTLKNNSIFDVKVINKNPYAENITRLPFSYDNTDLDYLRMDRSDYIVGEVKTISEKEIELMDGKKITHFDILVLSTGSFVDNSKLNLKDLKVPIISGNDSEAFFKHQNELKEANTITILGSGSVGVEYLGSFCEAFPDKKIYLISKSKKFLERNGDSAHNTVSNFIQKKSNCIIKLGETIQSIEGNIIKLQNEDIQTDLILSCIGFSPRTDFLKSNMSSILDNRGFIKVNPQLQVEGYSTIFGMGDILNLKEEKLAQTAMEHADLVAKNIENLILGKELETHKVNERTILVSIGNNYSMVLQGSNGVKASGYLLSYAKLVVKYKLKSSLKEVK
eukprot:gene5617-9434_t